MTAPERARLTLGEPVTMEHLAWVGWLEGRLDDVERVDRIADTAATIRRLGALAEGLQDALELEAARHRAADRSMTKFRHQRDAARQLARRALDLCQRQRALLRATTKETA